MSPADIRILVVDDEREIREVFSHALRDWGYVVETAADGTEALDTCRRQPFHIVLTDLNMPHMSGTQLMQRIRSRWPLTEVIVITGFGTIENAIESMKIGASDFILKPVNLEQVRLTIRRSYQKIRAYSENRELRELNAQLRELNDMKDKFLSITNHEIRTPLTIIRGYLEVLEDLMAPSEGEVGEIFGIIQRTTDQLSTTVDRMHILSEIHHTKFACSDERVNLARVARRVYDDLSPLFRHRSVELSVAFPKRPVYARASDGGVRLLLQELLNNGLKYTPDGGRVQVRVAEEAGRAVLSVEDTGIGIPFEKNDLVFAEFYELQNAIYHKTSMVEFKGGGMGIGLPLVKYLVESMDGAIDLVSNPGEGSAFRITLPLFPANTEVFHDTPCVS